MVDEFCVCSILNYIIDFNIQQKINKNNNVSVIAYIWWPLCACLKMENYTMTLEPSTTNRIHLSATVLTDVEICKFEKQKKRNF